VFAIGTLAAVELAVLALKAAVGRAGPGIWADREDYPGYFPSGHAATAMSVVAIGVFMAYRLGLIRLRIAAGEEIAVLAGLAVGLVAGAGAVVSDSHWASDVVGGVALAAVILVPALALCRGYLDGAGADGTSRRSSAGTRRLGRSSSP
jgi:undecaprenyl-diphosphatase